MSDDADYSWPIPEWWRERLRRYLDSKESPKTQRQVAAEVGMDEGQLSALKKTRQKNSEKVMALSDATGIGRPFIVVRDPELSRILEMVSRASEAQLAGIVAFLEAGLKK